MRYGSDSTSSVRSSAVIVEECIEIALQAPTGSNAQGWHFVLVEDAEGARSSAELYGRNFDPYFKNAAPTEYTRR